MAIIDARRAACLLTLMLSITSSLAAPSKEVEAAMGRDGLEKISVKELDLAYVRPGATLTSYKRVKLDPVDVEFRAAQDPARTGSAVKLSSEERERIRARVAGAVQEEFTNELKKNSSYQVTSDAGPDVLRVKARVLDLYVSAPDVGPGRTRTLVSSAGQMTLLAELSDSVGGQVLARVADHRQASQGGRMYVVNGAVNEAEARKIAAGWARILRKALDRAHGIGR